MAKGKNLRPLHVVAQQQVLIAQVKLASRYYRVRPAILVRSLRLREPPVFFVAVGPGLDQRDGAALAFLTQIQMAVGINQRAFAQFVFFLPLDLAGLEVLAGPALAVRIAIM